MKVHIFETDYGTVTCSYFFDADVNGGSDGIDVSIDGNHIGEIWERFPDLEEEGEEGRFEEEVTEWLNCNF